VEPRWLEGALDDDWCTELQGSEVLVHMASHTPNPPYAPLDECLYWNVYAPIKLANQAVKSGVRRFLVAGSCFEYGAVPSEWNSIPIDAPLAPSLSYPTSKAAASIAFQGFARDKGVLLRIMRIFQVYGPGEQASRLWPSLQAAALSGADFPMTAGEQVRDFVRVEDVATQFLEQLTFEGVKPSVPTIKHVASGRAQSLLEFASFWWAHWGATGQLRPGVVPYRNNEIMRLVPEL
jgi:nucleoside-diphosphate-sugar epimerase